MKTRSYKSKVAAVLSAKDEFISELSENDLFTGTPPEAAVEALEDISEILDSVGEVNELDDNHEFGDDEEDGMLDAAEEISAQSTDDSEELFDRHLKSSLDAADGETVVLIEVSLPSADIELDMDKVDDNLPGPSVEDVSTEEVLNLEDTPAAISNDDIMVPSGAAEGEEEDPFLKSSLGKALSQAIVQKKGTLSKIAQAHKKSITARRVTVFSGWRERGPEYNRAWNMAAFRFSSDNGRFPTSASDLALVQINASRVLSNSGKLALPEMDLSQHKSGGIFRAFVLSALRRKVGEYRSVAQSTSEWTDAKVTNFISQAKTDADVKTAAILQSLSNFVVPSRKIRSLSQGLAEYVGGKLAERQVASLFQALVNTGKTNHLDEQGQSDLKALVAAKLVSPIKGRFLSQDGDESVFDWDDDLASEPGGKNVARLPNGLPKRPGLPNRPDLLASAAKVQTRRGAFPTTSSQIEGADIPGVDILDPNDTLGRAEAVTGKGVKAYGVESIGIGRGTQKGGFSMLQPSATSSDPELIDVQPLALKAAYEYRITPFTPVNQSVLVAAKSYIVSMDRSTAQRLGFPVTDNHKLFSAEQLPMLSKLLTSATKVEDASVIERTVLNHQTHQASILKNSAFASILVKAGLVSGLNNSEYDTFRRIGDSYVSEGGNIFSSVTGLKYGKPDYMIVAKSNKALFSQRGQVKASVNFQELALNVDRQILAQARRAEANAQSRATATEARLRTLSQSFKKIQDQGKTEAVVASRQIANLTRVNSSLKQENTALKLEGRGQNYNPKALTNARSSAPEPARKNGLVDGMFRQLGGTPNE